MKVFITVGTTQFDSLIYQVVKQLNGKYDITAQVSEESTIVSLPCDYFTFSSEFYKYVNEADVIITHAGAGSVYSFLELNKKIIVVPNMERADKHQIELASFVNENNYGLIGFIGKSDFFHLINELQDIELSKYEPERFFYLDELYKKLGV
ncbi:PssE/Cps14G family polysaccharide biosynthesis glycosyltransferase [Vibrio cyclitrophicus]|uniref:Glycosyl transferase family 28 C-terminal domain-containing protein n=2 Tax=Vibrio cyclitrophicus TaxID=47951 RepID=A0A7Z1MIT8_9VIBR|nr:PssE/Cps14G family polysaccharide biosynthesis glycosyltransferase [Vibrio cyclitrophicus]MCC4775175.1 glycosyltransferase [Vibrio cyclitrophicus]MCC4841153.1 glycosyltransferase [Vibrio cyclitrophicus]PME12503.1 hypothetical protein BCV42_19735 [Vibrio cyclitrophicus]PME46899.1 hypothetical protein BCV37_13725 [Vibrio cyclitrophicus]PME76049.1 hypothetical protein BCV28_09940 [Vibrio cyclitrophicus]